MNFERREPNEIFEQEFSWNNDLENLDEAQALTEEKLKELGWPDDQADAFAFAVREVMMNAIVHGNLNINRKDGAEDFVARIRAAQRAEENKSKQVKLHFRFTKDEATAQIKDEGTFVPDEIVDPTTEERLLSGSERGLPLIMMKVDNVAFSPGEVILHKQRKDNEDELK